MSTRTNATTGVSKSKTVVKRKVPREQLADGENASKKEEKEKPVRGNVARSEYHIRTSLSKAKTGQLNSQQKTKINKKDNVPSRKSVSNTPRKSEKAESRPATPPSTRVSKTQFFPNKKMYSAALLKANGIVDPNSDSRSSKPVQKISRNSAPRSDNKVPAAKVATATLLKKKTEKRPKDVSEQRELSSDSSTMSERPRTATLKRGSIVNENIVGPEAPEPIVLKSTSSKHVDSNPKTVENSARPRTSKATSSKQAVSNPRAAEMPASSAILKASSSKQVDNSPRPTEIPARPAVLEATSSNKSFGATEIPSQLKQSEPEDDTYEEDFDSYESDFDSYTGSSNSGSSSSTIEVDASDTSSESTSESSRDNKSIQKRTNSASTDDEKQLDSGNYDLRENRHKQLLDNINESAEKESEVKVDHSKNNMGSLSDEGFEDAKSSLQFINFLGAQKRYERRKSIAKKRKRGEEILSMIRLDTHNFTLFDMPSVPYEQFIRNYGRRNAVQTSVQTGDDDISEQVQTVEIVCRNKWTQFPANVARIYSDDANFWTEYKCRFVGVGGEDSDKLLLDPVIEAENHSPALEKFLLSAGNLILNLQAENDVKISTNKETKQEHKLPFSKSCIVFKTKCQEILRNRCITSATFCPNNPGSFITVHAKDEAENSHANLICLWKMSNNEEPALVLSAFGDITSHTFSSTSDFLFAGLTDGSILAWVVGKGMTEATIDNDAVETPTFCTDVNCGHVSKVTSIISLNDSRGEEDVLCEWKSSKVVKLGNRVGRGRVFRLILPHGLCPNQKNRTENLYWMYHPKLHQRLELERKVCIGLGSEILSEKEYNFLKTVLSEFICSLDEEGSLIIWSTVYKDQSMRSSSTTDFSSMTLIVNYKACLKPLHQDMADFKCTCMAISSMDSNHIYVATNIGIVLHCLANGTKPSITKYYSKVQSQINCLQICPIFPEYFAAGFDNGDFKLYSGHTAKALISFSNRENLTNTHAIDLVQWSSTKPFIFYVKDSSNTLHLWNLEICDIMPTYSIPFKDDIVDVRLSSQNLDDQQQSYMIIATRDGSVYLHSLNDQFECQSSEEFEKNKQKFLNYMKMYV